MLVPEKESKNKFCPMIKDESYGGANCHHEPGTGDDQRVYAKCLGSLCMMWVVMREGVSSIPVDTKTGSCGLIRPINDR